MGSNRRGFFFLAFRPNCPLTEAPSQVRLAVGNRARSKEAMGLGFMGGKTKDGCQEELLV